MIATKSLWYVIPFFNLSWSKLTFFCISGWKCSIGAAIWMPRHEYRKMDCQHWSSLWIFCQVSNFRLGCTEEFFIAEDIFRITDFFVFKCHMAVLKRNGSVSVINVVINPLLIGDMLSFQCKYTQTLSDASSHHDLLSWLQRWGVSLLTLSWTVV